MKKYKIALVYLDVTNIGDVIIYETARYILESVLTESKIDYEIIPVDIGAYRCRLTTGAEKTKLGLMKRKFYSLLLKKGILEKYFPDLALDLIGKRWALKGPYKYYMENEAHKLEGVDAIVFGGGGLIKFHKQNFHHYIDVITKYADKHKIPVILNAQGVEGYKEDDIYCRLLKRALNRDCVKYVSTRDDYATLKNCFMTNPDTVVKAVCDPAFWVPETYQAKKQEDRPKKIGINVIRTKIFAEYMYEVDRDELGEVYYETIQSLCERGYQVEFFSNGVKGDIEFISFMLEKYPDLQTAYGVTVSNPESTKDFVETISGYDRFIAVRLHAAITGTVLGVPNISIVWNNKQTMFGEQIGMPQNFLKKDNFKADVIVDRLLKAEPYEMNWDYKMTVYNELKEQLVRILDV